MRSAPLISGVLMCYLSLAQCPDVSVSFTASPANICGSGATSVNFSNTSTGVNASSALYTWYLNGTPFDNTTGLAAPASSSVSSIGTYTYMLIVNDTAGGCLDTAYQTVVIHPVPGAAFTFNPNNQCAGTNISFNNNTTGTDSYTTYYWDFGDGNNSTAANPTYAYGAGGTYTVTLTVTNGPGCTSTSSTTVTALAIPTINISGDDGDGNLMNCLLPADTTSQETVTFSNFTTNAVSYSWDFGDGSPVFNTNSTAPFTYTYTSYGTFTVTFSATAANGCTVTSTLTVVFEKYVSASFSVPILEMSGCAPHIVNAVNASVNATTYVWDFGDGSPPVTTTTFTPPPHTYTTGGSFTISVTASNSCNASTATVGPIVVVDGPTANFSTGLPGNLGCAPQNMTISNWSTNAQPANNYYWDMGNGNTYSNTTTPPMQTYNNTGTYTITLIAGNGCGTDTIIQVITIDTLPHAIFIIDPDTGCSPLTVTGLNFSTGNNLNYQWYVDGIYTTNSLNLPPQVLTAPPGNNIQTHTVQLIASNHCGTDDTSTTIVVHPAVLALFSMSDDTICEGDSIVITDGSYGDSLQWQWDFGNGNTSTVQGPHTQVYPLPGSYPIQLILNGYCGIDTLVRMLQVNPIPTANILPDTTEGCLPLTVNYTNNSTIGANYIWTFSGATPTGSSLFTPPPVTYNSPGTFTTILLVSQGGCSASDTVWITTHPLPVPAFTATPASGCSPLNVSFTNNTAPNPGNAYNWDFGNGNTSTAQNPAGETYLSGVGDSIYTIQLMVTTTYGCTDSIASQVTVHPLPVANFTAFPDTVCALDQVAFLNNSSGAGSYAWDFGDGNTSTAMSPMHAYQNAGTYTAQLIASTVYGCTDTFLTNIVVDSIPNANFNFSIECFGDSTVFTDLSTGGITNWYWQFGDGDTSNLINPSHLYPAAGIYTVSLTVTNMAGCTHTIQQSVTVNTVPVAAFNWSQTCLGQNMQFTDNTSGVPVSWQWDFGDGSPTVSTQNPSYQYADTGSYTVTLIVSGGSGCFDTISNTVYVDSVPAASFTAANACTGDSLLFTSGSTGNPDNYSWDFGDGNFDFGNNTSTGHIYSTSGNYTVILTAAYSWTGCSDTAQLTVNSYPRTIPSFTNNIPCLGAATVFTDNTTGNPASWQWDFGDGSPSSNTQNPQYIYSTPGTYQVTLTTSNSFGCVDSIKQIIQVYPLPTANFSADTVCDGALTSFSDSSLNAVAWSWDFGDGSPLDNTQNPTHQYPASGNYTAQLIVTNSDGCTDTIWENVVVNPNPVADFTAMTACHTYPTQFTDNSSNAVSWQWDFGDGSPADFTQSPQHTYATNGLYNTTLLVTNIFGCADSITLPVTVLPQPQSGFLYSTVCANQPIQFTDTSFGSPSSWSWDFGDGSPFDNTQNPLHNYTSGGNYTITLITGNGSGCADTLVQSITVNTVPLPDFTADTVCLGNVTTFTDLSFDPTPIASWYWDFGDGNNSTSQNPTYIYQNPGVFNVTLTVTNSSGCDSTFSLPVLVTDVPNAGFLADTVCVGSPTTFTDTSTGMPITWFWDFGDGNNNSTGPVVQHTYASAGTYIVQLMVTGGNSCMDQTFAVVTVSSVVTAAIQAPDSACLGDVVSFTDASSITSGSITGWLWDFGDGNTSTQQNPTHSYNQAGTYNVVLSATSSGSCVSQANMTITISPLPVPAFTSTTPCENQPVQFTDQSSVSSGQINSWFWDFGDGGNATVGNPGYQYGGAGQYNVVLTVSTQAGCTVQTGQPVTVNPQPIASFTTDTVCPEDSTAFTDLSSVSTGNISSWNWDFGDGQQGSMQNPAHHFNILNDSFYVMLVVVTDSGCVDTTMQLVQTHPVPDILFQPLSSSGCAPFETTFEDLSTISSGTIASWLWDFGDNNYGTGQSTTHTYSEGGDYNATLSIYTTQGCQFSSTLSYPVTVFPQPSAGFDLEQQTLPLIEPVAQCIDLSTGAFYWQWDFGDGSGSTQSAPQHTYADTGTYLITQIVINNYGCADTAQSYVRVEGEFNFFIPNAFTPNDDHENDVFNGWGYGVVEYRLMIFNRWGEMIYDTSDPDAGWDGSYMNHPVEEGVYVYRFELKDMLYESHTFIGHVTVIR